MKIGIICSKGFEDYLNKYSVKVENTKGVSVSDGTYNAFFSNKKAELFLQFIISAYAPTIVAPLNEAIIDYVQSTKQELVVNTEEEQFTITPNNVAELMPMLSDNLMATLNEEQDGKDW